jgi:hypothetical protein
MSEVFGKVQGSGKESLASLDSISFGSINVAARASMVNRTHRIVRERARQMSTRRDRIRSLMVPLIVSGAMLVILITAVWTLLDQYEINPTGVVDSSDQYVIFLWWFLPLSLVALGMVWFTRMRGRRNSEIVR